MLRFQQKYKPPIINIGGRYDICREGMIILRKPDHHIYKESG